MISSMEQQITPRLPSPIPRHYTDFLKQEFQERSLRNISYSLRAFARDLNLTSGNLSDILNFKSRLSKEKANLVADDLRLSQEDKKLFLKLVDIAFLDDDKKAREQLQILNYDSSYITLADDYYRVLTEWYYFALVELVRVKDFRNEDEWIAHRLQIQTSDVRPAIERLLRVQLLKQIDGELIQTYDYFISPSGTPLDTARKFHKQLLQRAAIAIEEQSIEERNFTSGFLRVRKSDLPRIGEKIKQFRREMAAEIESGDEHDSVYAFSIQFFRGDAGKRHVKSYT